MQSFTISRVGIEYCCIFYIQKGWDWIQLQSFTFSRVGIEYCCIFYIQQSWDWIQLQSFTFSKVWIEYSCNLLYSAMLGLITVAIFYTLSKCLGCLGLITVVIFYFQQSWDWVDRCGIGYADGCNLLHDQNVDRLV